MTAATLDAVDTLNREAERRWAGRLTVDRSLSRALVSFQANKRRSVYRWFKYKEAFSAELVEQLLTRYAPGRGSLLDPFAGSGTALFVAGAAGMRAEGIELLPIGQAIIRAKQLLDGELTDADLTRLAAWAEGRPWRSVAAAEPVGELRITRGAYPPETLAGMGRYLAASRAEPVAVRDVLRFALLCVLESVSFTRKDGQYLRWDHRSERRAGGKVFDKGAILPFDEAVSRKLRDILGDLCAAEAPADLFAAEVPPVKADISLHSGSCLDILPALAAGSFDCVLTSPPYCNRYDYTRTYALELALLGTDEPGLVAMRQAMLSCTVENRAKDLLRLNPRWAPAVAAADANPLLQAVLTFLDGQKRAGLLNNAGIPRMVRGYFYEMACAIAECGRVLRSGAPLLMVNDNVRYAGAGVSADIILSEIAERVGFTARKILVLPGGKGNSSQQMGAHGRDPLRKCVYVWVKE